MSATKLARARLRSWLKRNKKTQVWLAEQLKLPPPRICEFLTGKRRIRIEAADAIEVLTGGDVTMRSLMGLPDRDAPRRRASGR